MARFENLSVGKLKVREISTRDGGAALIAKRAQALLEFEATNPGAGETVVIGPVTYSWIADPTTVDSTDTTVYVKIDNTEATAAGYLCAAINATGTPDTEYSAKANGADVKAHPLVTASIGSIDGAGDTVVITCRKAGKGGNAIACTETGGGVVVNKFDDGTSAQTTLTGGVDGNNCVDASNYTNLNFYNGTLESQSQDDATALDGSTGATNVFTYKGTEFKNFILGAGQTIIQPVQTAQGLDISGDATDNEGRELHLGLTEGFKHAYRIGRDGLLKFRVKFEIADVSDTDTCLIGWRKAEACQADYNDYDEMAAFNINAGFTSVAYIKNGAATVSDGEFDFVDGDVSTANNTITEASHGLTLGTAVKLANSGGAVPTGLSAGTVYYVIVSDANTIKLASSLANALAGTAVDITDASGGGTHTLHRNWSDTETHELEVLVGIDGTPDFYMDGYHCKFTPAGTMKFDGNEVIVPFIHHLHAASSTSGIVLKELECGQVL